MATITLKGNPVHTSGQLPSVGSTAPDFTLTRTDLKEATLKDFAGKRIILNIFPSIDTGVCQASVRSFNASAEKLDNTVVLCVSNDLPFAQARFCGAEGLANVVPLSGFRHHEFAERYGLLMQDGPLAGLMSRAVVVLDPQGKIVYEEQVPEITQEPNYEAALKALK
jgi:thiol peroxidase